jgi:tRNA threonylcarbamoyladenosine biosynthesis protein TsaE
MGKKLLIEHEAKSTMQTKEFAKRAVQYFKPGDIILLYGDLGSGKTFLTKQFVRFLGLSSNVSSPSFTIVNQYAGKLFVNHIDLYRISSINELNNVGLDDLWNMDCINFIEWPQLIESYIDWTHYRIYINFFETDNIRRFKLYKYSFK